MAKTKLSVLGVPFTPSGPRNYVRTFEESLGVTDDVLLNLDNWDAASAEIRVVEDTVVRRFHKFLSESIGADDNVSKGFGRGRSESIGVDDAFERQADYVRNPQDGLDLNETLFRDTFNTEPENVTVSDAIAKTLHRNLIDGLDYREKTKYPFYRDEDFTVSDEFDRIAEVERSFDEELDYSVLTVKSPGKFLPEELEFEETYVRHIYKNLSESMRVNDTLLRNASAVMFDLVIRDDVLSWEELDEVSDSPPVGYTPFRRFHPGDYEFQEFMTGIRLTGPENQGQAGILGLKHNVDVPDVTERGEATVTAGDISGNDGEHDVTFTKTFTAVPEVYPVWINGATPALPEIISVTETGFTFILRDITSPSTKVEGTISWAVIGR